MASSIPQTPAQRAPPRFHSLEYWAGSPNEWQLDVLHDFPSKLKDAMKIHLDDRGIDFERKLRRASYLFIYDAVAELEGQKDDTESWEQHRKIFYKWMKSVVERGKAGTLAQGSEERSEASPGMKKRLVADLVVENAAGALTCRIGRKLASIVRGEIAPLELMMEGNLLHDYYQDHPRMKTRAYKHLRQIAELYSVKHPDANVMEIGAGTGGATAIVLEAFEFKDENGSFESLLGHFDFTDISLGFFKTARLKFVPWTGLMDYKTLDITSDPVKQSFLAGSYDLIVASAVLRATPNLNKTLTHVRKLLKPGGKLLMVEFTQDSLDTQLIFGTLPGWWLGEEQYRKTSPNVPIETWDKVLRATGFSGVDVEMRDCEQSEFQSLSIILTTAADLQPSYPLSISIVDTSKYAPQAWLNGLQEAIQAKVGTCHIIRESFEDLELKRDTVFIFLSEMATPFLDKLGNTASEKLRRIMLNSEGILWLSCNSIMDTKQSAGQAQCLLRAMQQEDSNKRYVELDFEAKTVSPWSQDKIPHIVHVLQQNFNKNIGITDNDQVYAVKNSILYVPRIYPAPEFLSALLKATSL